MNTTSALFRWIALRRVLDNQIRQVGDRWFSGSRRVPCYLPSTLDLLLRDGLIELPPCAQGHPRARATAAGINRFGWLDEHRPWTVLAAKRSWSA